MNNCKNINECSQYFNNFTNDPLNAIYPIKECDIDINNIDEIFRPSIVALHQKGWYLDSFSFDDDISSRCSLRLCRSVILDNFSKLPKGFVIESCKNNSIVLHRSLKKTTRIDRYIEKLDIVKSLTMWARDINILKTCACAFSCGTEESQKTLITGFENTLPTGLCIIEDCENHSHVYIRFRVQENKVAELEQSFKELGKIKDVQLISLT